MSEADEFSNLFSHPEQPFADQDTSCGNCGKMKCQHIIGDEGELICPPDGQERQAPGRAAVHMENVVVHGGVVIRDVNVR